MKYTWVILILLLIAGLFWFLNQMALKNDHPKARVLPFMPEDKLGITLPPFGVFVNEKSKNDKVVLKHEQCHWKQYQNRGLYDFWKDYINGSRTNSYAGHPMEIECFKAEKDL